MLVIVLVPGVMTASVRVAHGSHDAGRILLQHLHHNTPDAPATRSRPFRFSAVTQRQGRLRCFGLGLTADELVADPLDLLADVQLGGVKVDRLPGEPK
jgi:hypothetical protein